MGKLIKILFFFSFIVSASSNHPFFVINRCSQTIWAGTYGENDTPLGGSFRLNPNEQRSFTAIRGWTAGRIWAKTGCDSTGRKCATGETAVGGRTSFQAVTLAEFGLDKWMGLDFYDISLIDGFNIPISIKPFGTESSGNCRRQGCNFNLTTCPETFKEFNGKGNSEMIACKSACTATKEAKYCCPEDKVPQEKCRSSEYSKVFKKQCPDSYTWAYDFDNSDRICRGNPVSGYEVTFCG